MQPLSSFAFQKSKRPENAIEMSAMAADTTVAADTVAGAEEEKKDETKEEEKKEVTEVEEKEVSANEAIQIFQRMKREAQMMLDKISELQYELGEHELVETNMGKLPEDRTAYRLVGGVLVKQTVGDVLPKVLEHKENLGLTIENLRKTLNDKQDKAKAWKVKYDIKTQQEHELETRARAAQQQAAASKDAAEPSGVLA